MDKVSFDCIQLESEVQAPLPKLQRKYFLIHQVDLCYLVSIWNDRIKLHNHICSIQSSYDEQANRLLDSLLG